MASVYKRGGKKAKSNYYVSWFDENGVRQTKSSRTTDKAAATRIANKLEAEAALRREGVVDASLDLINRQAQLTIEEHLSDFVNKMQSAGRTEKHIKNTARIIRLVADSCGASSVGEITADGVHQYAVDLQREGKSARTVQSHLVAIKAFTKWLAESEKLPRNPLANVKKPNPAIDRRMERRMLLPDEWRWLVATTTGSGRRYGVSALDRLLLYETAIQTGLRSNELRSLTTGRLYLNNSKPYITCKAGSTKNRRDARQYIRPSLAKALKTHLESRQSGSNLFDLPHETNLARMLRGDLQAARGAWLGEEGVDASEVDRRQNSDFLSAVNHEGEQLDFHSLRHTCGAWLAMTGAHPKVVQQVMRHQSITLTMDTYGHLFPGTEHAAIQQLEQYLNTSNDWDVRAQRIVQQSGRPSERSDAAMCDGGGEVGPTIEDLSQAKTPGICKDMQADATACKSSGGGIRTPDTRIMIPLL